MAAKGAATLKQQRSTVNFVMGSPKFNIPNDNIELSPHAAVSFTSPDKRSFIAH
jgi:hypothetical protein